MKAIERQRARRVSIVFGLALLAMAQACQDASGPGTRVVSVTIIGAPANLLTVGDTVRLTTSVRNTQGEQVASADVSWSTTAPAVAGVSNTGLVTALSPGTAQIVAAVGEVADTVPITVRQPFSSAGCATGGLSLAVGEVRPVDPAAEEGICLPGATAAGADYVLVAFNGRESGLMSLTVETTAGASTVRASRIASPAQGQTLPERAGPRLDWRFEAELRRRERQELGRRLPAARASVATGIRRSVSGAAVPAVGSIIDLNVSLEACTSPTRRGGRVVAVTDRAIVVHDTANPANGFTNEEYRQIGVTFDTLLHDVVTRNFGEPTDIDQNEKRVIIFYSRAVNELTEPNSESLVGGFFYGRDLFPTTGTDSCAGSNFAEMFYVLAPDPTGVVNQNPRSKEDVREATLGTIAHEFEHLINASRRIYVNDASGFEESWLDEGLAHVAEELVFYDAAGLGPRQDIDVEDLRAGGARRVDAFNAYQGNNFGRLATWLEGPERNSPYGSNDDLATRGAAWAFLRYAVDRLGGDQASTWFRLVNSTTSGFDNLRAVLRTDPIPLARDWAVAMYADNLVAGADAIYQNPSWNFRSIFAAFEGSTGYPLRVRTLASGSTALTLVGGGAAYFSTTVSASGQSQVRFRSGGVAPPGTLSVFVIRIR